MSISQDRDWHGIKVGARLRSASHFSQLNNWLQTQLSCGAYESESLFHIFQVTSCMQQSKRATVHIKMKSVRNRHRKQKRNILHRRHLIYLSKQFMLFIVLKNRLSHVTKDEIKVQKKMSFLLGKNRREMSRRKQFCRKHFAVPIVEPVNDSKSHLNHGSL